MALLSESCKLHYTVEKPINVDNCQDNIDSPHVSEGLPHGGNTIFNVRSSDFGLRTFYHLLDFDFDVFGQNAADVNENN